MKEKDKKQTQENTTENTENKVDKEELNKKVKSDKETTKKSNSKKRKTKTDEISDLTNDLQNCQDKYLRLSAEFDNYRKRTLKEKIELSKTGGEKILIDLLPVVDDFDRAKEHINKAEDIVSLKDGIDIIYKKLQDFLKHQGVIEIEAKGKSFDTDLHEAISKFTAPTPEQKGKIIDIVEKGYTYNEKVIRFSKVVIGE